MCRICIDGEFWDDAERLLADLKRCDVESRFVHHRHAHLFKKQRKYDLALQETEVACKSRHCPFETFADKCDLLIELRRFNDTWGALHQLEHRFGSRHRSDVQIGLRTKLLVRQGKWREGRAAWDRLGRKDEPIHRMLLASILEAQAEDESLTRLERDTAKADAQEIRRAVGHLPSVDITEEEGFTADTRGSEPHA